MMRWFRTTLAALLLLAAAPLVAQNLSPAGRWALHAGGQTLIILELSRTGDAVGFWRGGFRQPQSMRWAGQPQGFTFSEVAGPVIERAMDRSLPRDDGVHIRFDVAMPGQPDDFVFRVAADGTGELGLPGSGQPPLQLVRAAAGEAVATAWDPTRTYGADRIWTSNAEMKAIFDADQADRTAGPAIDWAAVTPRDEARRTRTLALLNAGALRNGDDFYHAAFVFQHGAAPDDFLLAHTFAVIAAARGRTDATWIAAATLDRYLQNIGRKQVYGTQYSMPAGRPATQEPYDRTLVSDALRQALNVPPQADQERRRAELERQYRAAPAAAPPR